jgi:hypothetical protein
MSASVGTHERLARALLQLYPEPFRTRFGGDLVQLIGDVVRDARAGRPGSSGVAATWLGILFDVAQTAPLEHLDQRRLGHTLTRPPALTARILGLLAILGGLLLVSVWIPILRFVPETSNLTRLGLFNIGAIALALAVARGWAGSSRLIAPVTLATIVANAAHLAMLVASIGRPVYPLPDPEFRLLADFAGAAMWLTDAALGFVAWRLAGLRGLRRGAGLALGLGSLFAFAGMARLGLFDGAAGWFFAPASQVGIALNGIGFMLLGVAVATRRRPRSGEAGVPASS